MISDMYWLLISSKFLWINSLSSDKILDQPKLKAFADDEIKVSEKVIYLTFCQYRSVLNIFVWLVWGYLCRGLYFNKAEEKGFLYWVVMSGLCGKELIYLFECTFSLAPSLEQFSFIANTFNFYLYPLDINHKYEIDWTYITCVYMDVFLFKYN